MTNRAAHEGSPAPVTENSGLRALLDPASIAVVGASEDPNKFGGRLLRFLADYGFTGQVIPINPGRETVQGLPALRDVSELPEGVDLALVITAADTAPSVVAGCAERGVRACVVMSSGFGEVDADGGRRQREMVETAAAHGMRLLGPNCQGAANLSTGAVASFSSTFLNFRLDDGPLAIVSQSGAVAGILAALAHESGMGVRYWLSSGNEADITVADLIDAVLDDSAVRVVAAYCENIANGPRLATAAAKARRLGKAIIMLKSGTTPAGAKAAGSHTGALTQPDVVVEAFLRQHGIVRAGSLTELSDLARVFARTPPRGNRVAVVSNSGGLGVSMADTAVKGGLQLAELAAGTREVIRAALPGYVAAGNPIDMTGQVVQQPDMLSRLLRALVDDDGVDIVLLALGIVGPGYDIDALTEAISALETDSAERGLLAAVASVGGLPEFPARLRESGVLTFLDEAVCTRAVARFAEHSARVGEPEPGARPPLDQVPLPPAPTGGGYLSEHVGKELMTRWGLPVVPGRLVSTPGEAARVDLGYPLVVKLCSPEITHKSELGLVRLGLGDASAVEHAATEVLAAAKGANIGSIEGLLVERMVGGVEIVLGATWDAAFGPTILVGSGGVYVESLRDFRLLFPPFDRATAASAVQSLAVYPALAGVRGAPALDVEALLDTLLRFAEQFAGTGGALSEVDLNPVMVSDAGVFVVDALDRFASDGPSVQED
jgi:acyl-CoA synthetase (NDP forming)